MDNVGWGSIADAPDDVIKQHVSFLDHWVTEGNEILDIMMEQSAEEWGEELAELEPLQHGASQVVSTGLLVTYAEGLRDAFNEILRLRTVIASRATILPLSELN